MEIIKAKEKKKVTNPNKTRVKNTAIVEFFKGNII